MGGGVTFAPAAFASSLESEISTLLQTHPQIKAAKEGVNSAGEGVDAARSGYLPQVHIDANTGPEHWNNAQLVESFGKPITHDGYGAGVTVTQHLWDGHLTDSNVDAALGSKSVSESTLRSTREATILEGINAYLDVQRQARLVKLARTDEQRLQNQLHLEDERVQRGSGVAVDVLAAKHRLQLAKERRVSYEGALQQAITRYQQVFGHAPDSVDGEAPVPPQSMIPASEEDAVAIAEKESPSVQAAKGNVAVASEKGNAAEAGYWPTLDLVGRTDMGDYRDGNEYYSRDWEVLLQLNWDIFSGFRTQAQVRQAAFDYAASKDNAAQADRKAAEAVRLAWSQVETAKERVGILESAVNLAFDVWDDRKKMRESGKATVIDVLDAETDITNAQVNYTIASYDLTLATYQLLYGMGRLEPGNLDQGAPAAGATAPKAK